MSRNRHCTAAIDSAIDPQQQLTNSPQLVPELIPQLLMLLMSQQPSLCQTGDLTEKMRGAAVNLTVCRGAHALVACGMMPTMSGKVAEAASLNRRLPRSCWRNPRVWSRSALLCPMMAISQASLGLVLSLQTSGGQAREKCH